MSAKDQLDNIKVNSPCTADWGSMVGNDQVRFCQHCNLSVHDLSKLTRKKALRLITRSNGRLCVRYILLPDGSIKTSASPHSIHRIGRHASRLAAGAFSATLTVSGATAATVPLDRSTHYTSNLLTAQAVSVTSNTATGAAIKGFVFDPNGAVITNATVAISCAQNKLTLSTITNSDGEYGFDGLEAGDYVLKIEAPGFAPNEVRGITLRADREDRIDQTLGIAPIEASVEVKEEVFEIQGGAMMPFPKEPLVRAAQSDDLEAVKQMLAGKPNVNLRDRLTDSTALEHAVLNSNREMVQVLLWAGADVNARDKKGRTAIMMLGDDVTPEIVWDLINAGAKVNSRDNNGDTALTEAAASNNPEALRTLLDAGAKVEVKNNAGETALMLAASEGLVNNVRVLILAGADVNARSVEGKTAWMLAVENDHKAILRLLRSYGADETIEPRDERKQP